MIYLSFVKNNWSHWYLYLFIVYFLFYLVFLRFIEWDRSMRIKPIMKPLFEVQQLIPQHGANFQVTRSTLNSHLCNRLLKPDPSLIVFFPALSFPYLALVLIWPCRTHLTIQWKNLHRLASAFATFRAWTLNVFYTCYLTAWCSLWPWRGTKGFSGVSGRPCGLPQSPS